MHTTERRVSFRRNRISEGEKLPQKKLITPGSSRDRGRPSTPFLRERVLNSATRLFSATEFDQVTIDAVAADAGVGKGSVYRQFGSKEELYAAAVVEGFVQLQKEIRAALKDNETLADEITTIISHTIRYFWTRRQFFEFLRDPRAVPPKLERQYRSERAKLALMIGEVLKMAASSGAVRADLDERVAAEALLGMVRGVNRYGREYTSPPAATRTIVSIFLGGCLSNPPADARKPRKSGAAA
jgi:AcrR family transcriptional regulator